MHQSLKIMVVGWVILSLFRPVFAGENAQNYYGMGVFAYEEGNYAEAEQFLTKAVKMDPENARAHFYLGQTYFKQKRLDLAESSLTRAFSLDPEFPGLNYCLGLLYYENMDFDKALSQFQKVAPGDDNSVLATYYSGISQYKLEEYAAAEKSLLAAAKMSPTIEANGNYYAGICNYHLDRLDTAESQFSHVAEIAEADDLRENARLWIKTIQDKRAALKPWSLYLKTAYVFDDNVVLEPAEQDIVSDEKDSALMTYLNGDWDLIRGPRLAAGVGYSHYQTWYQDLSDYDLTGSIGNFYLNYQCNESLTLGLKYLPTYYWVDSDSYLMQHQMRPSLTWAMDPGSALDASYGYYRNNYFTDDARDGHANEVSFDYSRALEKLDAYVFCGVGYEINSAAEKDEDFSELKTLAGISCDVSERTNITVYGNYFDKDYDDSDFVYGVKREDFRYSLSAAVTRNFWKEWLYAGAEYNYTKNNSNIRDFDYDRNVFRLFVSVKL